LQWLERNGCGWTAKSASFVLFWRRQQITLHCPADDFEKAFAAAMGFEAEDLVKLIF
jgi:hypothetical protein